MNATISFGLTFAMAVAMFGCTRPSPPQAIPTAPAQQTSQNRVAVSGVYNSEQQEVADACERWLVQEGSVPYDVEISVGKKRSNGNYGVLIEYVTGRGENDEPHFAPGAHTYLTVSADGTVLDFLRGQ
jgi:hypothetical protein